VDRLHFKHGVSIGAVEGIAAEGCLISILAHSRLAHSRLYNLTCTSVLGGQRALGLHVLAELLVEAPRHIGGPERPPLVLRKLEKGEQLLAALPQAVDDARAARRPFPLEGRVGAARGRGALGLHDAMEVSPDLGERVLGRLALEGPQLVDGTALDRGLGPDEADGFPEAEMSVDLAPHWGGQSGCHQIIETPLPGFERLASRAELQRQELLLPVGEDRDDSQDWDAHDLPRTTHSPGPGIEIQPHDVERGQRPRAAGFKLGLERPHDPRDRTPRERRGPAELPGVAPGQVGRDHRLVDLAHTGVVGGRRGRAPLAGSAGREHHGPGHGEHQRPDRPRQRPRLGPAAIAAPTPAAGVLRHAQGVPL
jgi:hypothetical protein